MKFSKTTVAICLLLIVIGAVIASSSIHLKEGLEMATNWKTNGSLGWSGSYNVPTNDLGPTGMSFLANNPANADCCKENSSFSTAGGCLCISPQQYIFLKQRGGNNVGNDGLSDGW